MNLLHLSLGCCLCGRDVRVRLELRHHLLLVHVSLLLVLALNLQQLIGKLQVLDLADVDCIFQCDLVPAQCHLNVGLKLLLLFFVRRNLDEDTKVVQVKLLDAVKNLDVVLTDLVCKLVSEVSVLQDVGDTARQCLRQSACDEDTTVENVSCCSIRVSCSELLYAHQSIRARHRAVACLVEACNVTQHAHVLVVCCDQTRYFSLCGARV